MQSNAPEKNKNHRLLIRFIIMFAVFLLIALSLSCAATYYNLNNQYTDQFEQDLKNMNHYMRSSFEGDGEDFRELVAYYRDNIENMRIPYPYDDAEDETLIAFRASFAEQYPGEIFGDTVHFRDLTGDTKLLYAQYLYIKWLKVFDKALVAFDLDYVYFIYPTENDHEMCYMFDAFRETENIDGQDYLIHGINVYEDPGIHAHMWEAWDTSSDPTGYDILDNEFGHVYTYSTPVTIDGETIGLVTSEIGVGYVRSLINRVLARQYLFSFLVLGVCTLVMLFFVKSYVLDRIDSLATQVRTYATDKDPALSDTIRSVGTQNDEITELSTDFADMIDELTEYMDNLQKLTAEKERIGAELNVARNIQASMLPRIFPAFPQRDEFDLFASMTPAKEVGGDFYDFFLTDDDHIALVIADVSGKGVPAALFMAISKALIKDCAQTTTSPAEIFYRVNNQLCEGNDEELFVTVWLGILDLRSGVLTFADAGHEFPVLLRPDSDPELVKAVKKRPPLATMEEMKYMDTTIELNVGDILFLYTDGVPEATDLHEELYGMDRLSKALTGKDDLTPEEILSTVNSSVDAFVGEASQFDDLTMLAIKINKLNGDGGVKE